jgi:hypothetical protein
LLATLLPAIISAVAADMFRGIRREIALALRDGRERTLYEISKAVARRPGDIQRTVRQMHVEKLLLADSDEPTRGTLFRFNDAFSEVLEESLADSRPTGQMAYEQRTLQIMSPESVDLYRLLGRAELNGMISWAAEWGGDGEWLLTMLPGTEKDAVDRLVGVLRSAGIRCQQRRVGQILSAGQLRRLIGGVDYAREVTI